MSDLVSASVRSFCESLASKEPTPGGGSASALTGAHAAALLCMYCRLTLGREKFADAQERMNDALEELERARTRLLELVDLDAKAYQGVMKALKMPKGTDSQKATRGEVIQAATRQAARVPLEVCTWAVRLLQVAEVIHQHGNPNALSDAGVGVQLAMAAFSGAALNVYINLESIQDETFKVSSRKTVHDLETQARALSTGIAAKVYGRLRVDG